jgi:hypothetical protein
MITNARGEFFFSMPRAGRRDVTITMLGYKQLKTSVTVRADTTVQFELEVEAVQLGELVVRKTKYTLRGEVRDTADQPVVDADVNIGRDKATRTNLVGRFKVGGLPTEDSVIVHVSALGLMPQVARIRPERDTTLRLVMKRDPIGHRMMTLQVERLEERLNGTGASVRRFDHEEIMRQAGPTIYDIVIRHLSARQRLPTPSSINLRPEPVIPCLFIDERRAMFGLEELMHLVPETVERIELIDRGTMVRVYTRRYIQQMIRRRANPAAIVIAKGTGQPICH